MRAIPQLVSASLNPTPIAEHFRILYVRRRHIPGIVSITFCQVTDLNVPQLNACFNYLAHNLAPGTISSKYQLKRKL